MEIYSLSAVEENCGTMVIDGKFGYIEFLKGNPQKKGWKPVKCIHADKKKRKPIGDFSGIGVNFISKHAAEVLESMLVDKVELLPVECDFGEYYLMNIIYFADTFDADHSEVEYFESSHRIMTVYKHEFKKDALAGKHIFRLREVGGEIFVDDVFKNTVMQAGLTGFTLEKVWSDDPKENEMIKQSKIRRWSQFKIVQAIDEVVLKEINENREYMVSRYNCSESGKEWSKVTYQLLEEYLLTKKIPEYCDDELDFELMLGSLFGEALRVAYDWKWMTLGNQKEDVTYYIVSPHDYYCCQPFFLIEKIMKEENTGLDGENDNTVLLLFNMCETIEESPAGFFHKTIS